MSRKDTIIKALASQIEAIEKAAEQVSRNFNWMKEKNAEAEKERDAAQAENAQLREQLANSGKLLSRSKAWIRDLLQRDTLESKQIEASLADITAKLESSDNPTDRAVAAVVAQPSPVDWRAVLCEGEASLMNLLAGGGDHDGLKLDSAICRVIHATITAALAQHEAASKLTIGEKIIDSLKDFSAKLQSGEPIEATRVERHEDGSVTREAVKLIPGDSATIDTSLPWPENGEWGPANKIDREGVWEFTLNNGQKVVRHTKIDERIGFMVYDADGDCTGHVSRYVDSVTARYLGPLPSVEAAQ